MINRSHSPKLVKRPRPLRRVENTTDATRGEPLGVRAHKRKLELERALDKLPVDALRERNDIAIVVATLDSLLTGDADHLANTTASDINRLLENSKHLAEVHRAPRSRS